MASTTSYTQCLINTGAIEPYPLSSVVDPIHNHFVESRKLARGRIQHAASPSFPATVFPGNEVFALPLRRGMQKARARRRQPLAALLGPGTFISGLHAANKALICWCSDATLRDTVGMLLYSR